ncbi:MAG: hypothetical protein ACP5QA_07895 [Phycisphaerae bacterium]
MVTTSRLALLASAVASLGIAAYGSVSHASTMLVSDGFSGVNGSLINGRTPDGANLPGSTWQVEQQNATGTSPMTIDTSTGNPAPSANTNFNDAAGISIASANGYIEPAVLTISADLNMGTITGGGLSYNVYGVGLGFWNALPASGSNAVTGFTGVTMDPYGDLTFINNGTASATAKAAAPSSATVVGGYISGFNTLTYSINTGTGAITQLTFDGTDLTSAFSGLTAFTPSVATLSGFFGNDPYSASDNGYVDNFSVSTTSAVPEPAAICLFAVGGMGLLLVGRKRAVRHGR